jgi:hypothetical protein
MQRTRHPIAPLFHHSNTPFRKWSARQDLHLRSLGPRPSMLLLHYALLALTAVSSGQEKRRTPNLGNGPAVRLINSKLEARNQDFRLEMQESWPSESKIQNRNSKMKWRSRWDLHPHSSRRQRVAFLFSYGSDKMVGGAGNAPVVTSDVYFSTLVLQTSSRIASRGKFEVRVFEMVAGVGVAPT